MRTRLSICTKKIRYASEADALLIAQYACYPLRPYRCDRCQQFHLTSRTKGKRVTQQQPEGETAFYGKGGC
jgi:hypothetical protein